MLRPQARAWWRGTDGGKPAGLDDAKVLHARTVGHMTRPVAELECEVIVAVLRVTSGKWNV